MLRESFFLMDIFSMVDALGASATQ